MCKSWYSHANKPVNMIIYIWKTRRFFNKTRSPPASLQFKGHGSEHTIVKWPITCRWQSHSFVSNKFLPSSISNLTINKNELWETVWPTSFQTPQLQSVSIFFKFVHTFLLFHLLSFLFLLFYVLSSYFMFHWVWWWFLPFEFREISWRSSFKGWENSNPTEPHSARCNCSFLVRVSWEGSTWERLIYFNHED